MDIFYLGKVVDLAEPVGRARVQLLRVGKWRHPSAPNGTLEITPTTLREFQANFRAGVVGPDLPMEDADGGHHDKHRSDSPSWIRDMELSLEGDKLYGVVDVQDQDLLARLASGRMKYCSPEIDFKYQPKEITDGVTPTPVPVIKAVAWTNVPYIKSMDPASIINLAEATAEDAELAEGAIADLHTGTAYRAGKDDSDRVPGKADNGEDSIDGMPEQCRSCIRLEEGSCPFTELKFKVAAAGDGICPKYVSEQSQRPRDVRNDTEGDPSTPDAGEGAHMAEDPKKTEEGQGEAISLADFKALQSEMEKLKPVMEQVVTLTETNKALVTQLAEFGQRAADAESKALLAEDEAYVDQYLRDGKITPHQAETVRTIRRVARGDVVKLTDDSGAETEAAVATLLSELLDANESTVPLGETVHSTPRSVKLSDPSEELNNKAIAAAKEIAKVRGGDYRAYYGEAIRSVLPTKNGARA